MSKLKDITPARFRCDYLSVGCPSLFEKDESYVIIGTQVSPETCPELAGRLGPDERVVEIPAALLDDFFKPRAVAVEIVSGAEEYVLELFHEADTQCYGLKDDGVVAYVMAKQSLVKQSRVVELLADTRRRQAQAVAG